MRRYFLLPVLLLLPLVALPGQARTRVATLQLGSAQIAVDATSDAKVAIVAAQNHLDNSTRLALPDLRAWLDTALVVTTAHDPRKPGVKWTYSASGPDLFLYRTVSNDGEEYIVSVGRGVKISLVLRPDDAKTLLEDLAAAARLSQQMTARAMARNGGACSLGVTVALGRGQQLVPRDSAALWMDRVRKQIEIRLATVSGTPDDARRGVWFVVEEDGAVTGVRPDPGSSPALAELRDAIIQAGGWHAFRGVPGGRAVAIAARLAPACAK